jgi:Mg-chelatase subunit ChlD
MKSILTALLTLVAVALVGPSAASAQGPAHRVYLTATDAEGKPVAGLTSADVDVVEAGAQRQVSRLAPAADPMRLVLLVDNSDGMRPSIEDVRKSLLLFIDGIAPQHEIGLITVGNTPVVRQTPTIDHAKVKELAQKITTNGTTMLITAVMEMYDRFLKNADGRWPMFVIVTSDGPEGSTGLDPKKFNAMLQDMQIKDVVVHSIVMSTMGRGVEVEVSQAMVQVTHGHYDSISASSALPQKLQALAASITAEYDKTTAEYVLEYASPSTDPNTPLSIAIKRPGVNVTLSRGGRIR